MLLATRLKLLPNTIEITFDPVRPWMYSNGNGRFHGVGCLYPAVYGPDLGSQMAIYPHSGGMCAKNNECWKIRRAAQSQTAYDLYSRLSRMPFESAEN